jgi:hypothetical protein
LARRLILLLSHLFLGCKEDGTIPRPTIRISLMIHAIQRYVLESTSASPSVLERYDTPFWGRMSSSYLPIVDVQNFSPSSLVIRICLSRCY